MPPASFSIVVPTYGRPERLADCVNSMCALDYDPERFEVVVVEDGSGRIELVEQALAPHRGRIDLRLVPQPHAGPAAARNLGAKSAKNEYIAFTDDDCRVDPGWLSAFAERFAAAPHCIAGGRTVNALTDNLYTSASETLVQYIREYHEEKGAPFFATNNVALPRATFASVGGFDERFPLAAGEDRDFCDRCILDGHELVYVPAAEVTHYHSLTLRRFLRQHFNYGRGAFVVRRLRAARGSRGRIEFEPLRFYADLISYPLRGGAADRRLRLSLLMVASQMAHTAGFFAEKARSRHRSGDRP